MLTASRGQIEVLDALVDTGTIKAAAYKLHLSETAVEQRLQRLRSYHDMTTVQLAYAHGQKRIVERAYVQLTLWRAA